MNEEHNEENGFCPDCGRPHDLPDEIVKRREQLSPRQNSILNVIAICALLDHMEIPAARRALQQDFVMIGDISEAEWMEMCELHNLFADVVKAYQGEFNMEELNEAL